MVVAVLCAALVPALAPAQLPDLPPVSGDPDPTAPPPRENEPVVLTGQDFPNWSAPSNFTARLPLVDLTECQTFDEKCRHNHYAEPHFDSGSSQPSGAPVDRLLGYRWEPGSGWRQIPFQVDEQFTRYLANPASGFSFYSGEDQHTTYAYDREGFRWTQSDPADPCLARPDSEPARDPVQGLDHNDEVAFMASDAGAAAPAGTKPPSGIAGMRQVEIRDPANPAAPPRYVYVMRAGDSGPSRTEQRYVSYKRDANSNTFEKSESSYSNYGNAARGPYCDAAGNVVMKDGKPDIQRRRPRDYASIETGRYRFRYDGRWLMTQINISPDGGKTFGPDLVDRWKARAFQQDPGSETPCCGFEEEDTNWGGSSTLLGERSGPVRTIRETWGADSGTNVIRRETFYRDEMRMKTWLRVHVIPPLDGIYAQWDFNAGRVNSFYNSRKPAGVPIDGRNDELFGNFDDPCNDNYDVNDTGAIDQGYRSAYQQFQLCNAPYHQSVDISDPTMSEANVALGWSEVAGPNGTIVDRFRSSVKDLTPGGAAQSVVATPYYRDDSCFDDGTGSDPGPKVKKRSGDEPRTASDGTPRRCWQPSDGIPDGSDKFFQGSIGTHGVHILFLVDSDNARQTVPISEIVSEQRMVMLPGDPGNVGAQYGTAFDRPLTPVAEPARPGARGDDGIAPTVKLTVRRHGRSAAKLRWRGSDQGGSGVRSYAVQVRRGKKGKWRTIRRSTRGTAYRYRARRSGRYEFRVRATDRAGNRGRWAGRAVKLQKRR